MDKIELPDNPIEALHEISSYLRTVSMHKDRAIREISQDVDSLILRCGALTNKDPLIVGYYQLTEWLEGLLDIADECDRIEKANEPSSVS